MKEPLSKERRAELERSLRDFCADELEHELGELGAARLVDFFLAALGPALYNQGVHDAVEFVQEKLMDLEGELHLPEDPDPRRSEGA